MTKKRIEYIDAIRGATMLLVIYGHILYFGYGEEYWRSTSHYNNVFMLFRMPLFFFISGFLLYKEGFLWNFKNTATFIKKKFMAQVVPTLFWGGLYGLFFLPSLWNMCVVYDKGGYWFTWTLFEYFILYASLRICLNYIQIPLFLKNTIWILTAIIIYTISIPYIEEKLNIASSQIVGFIGFIEFRYYIYFLLGALTRKHYSSFLIWLKNGYMVTIAILAFLTSFSYIKLRGLSENPFVNEVYYIVTAISGIVIAISLFHKYEAHLKKQTRIGTLLQYIGTRTLDIYLIHYFFLPVNLQLLGDFFNKNQLPVIEFFISILLSAMVASVTLLVSHIIRLSPILSHYLLATKKE